MVMVLPAQAADTPAGNPFAPDTPLFEMPVAPVVEWVILVSAVLIHRVGVEDAAPTVLFTVQALSANIIEAEFLPWPLG